MTGDGSAELAAIARTLELTGLRAPAIATGLIVKSGAAIQRRMRADAEGIGHAPSFPASITTDLTQTFAGPEVEIGPDKDRRQGALGNILYYGTSKNGPVRNLIVGIEAELPLFEKALGDAAEPKL